MTPELNEVVDPVFTSVIDFLKRVEDNKAEDPQKEQGRIRNALDGARRQLAGGSEWALISNALIYWIDEMLIMTEWPGRDWCSNNNLELELLGTPMERAILFFRDASCAAALVDKSALEVFYLCVALGFRGIYRDPDADDSLSARRSMQLPDTLEEWLTQTFAGICLVEPPEPDGDPEKIDGAPPLQGHVNLIWGLYLGLILIVLGGVVFAWHIFNQTPP